MEENGRNPVGYIHIYLGGGFNFVFYFNPTYQQLDERGPSPDIVWTPMLVPSIVNLDILHSGCPGPCEIHHIIAPMGTLDRRWLTGNTIRPVIAGRYIPVWWDLRRRAPADDTVLPPPPIVAPDDGFSLMQRTRATSISLLEKTDTRFLRLTTPKGCVNRFRSSGSYLTRGPKPSAITSCHLSATFWGRDK